MKDWRITWDEDNRPEQPQGWLRRDDGTVAMVGDDGRVLDPTDVDPDGRTRAE
ncbi:hypothetical protein [Nocardia callitridis]|uniref:Uncharacterized protein n=1 Tax=Nocardia callitridis TaxID=648753 RepID=A0ABP9K1C3_9NOCA